MAKAQSFQLTNQASKQFSLRKLTVIGIKTGIIAGTLTYGLPLLGFNAPSALISFSASFMAAGILNNMRKPIDDQNNPNFKNDQLINETRYFWLHNTIHTTLTAAILLPFFGFNVTLPMVFIGSLTLSAATSLLSPVISFPRRLQVLFSHIGAHSIAIYSLAAFCFPTIHSFSLTTKVVGSFMGFIAETFLSQSMQGFLNPIVLMREAIFSLTEINSIDYSLDSSFFTLLQGQYDMDDYPKVKLVGPTGAQAIFNDKSWATWIKETANPIAACWTR